MSTSPRIGFLIRWACVALFMLLLPVSVSASPEGVGDVGGEHAHIILDKTDELFTALFVDGDAAAVERIIGEDTEIRMPLAEDNGAEALVAYVDRVKSTYPGAQFDVISTTLFGPTATVTWRITGEAFRIDPTESAEAVRVEGTGQLEIVYGYPWADEVAVVNVRYETAISPLQSDAVAMYPQEEAPHQAAF